MDTIISKDPLKCYNLSSISFDTDGFDMELDVDIYILEEEGHVVTYGQVFGMWVREDTGMTVEDFLANGELPEIVRARMDRELSSIIREVKDPRVSKALVSITSADVTADMKYAKI